MMNHKLVVLLILFLSGVVLFPQHASAEKVPDTGTIANLSVSEKAAVDNLVSRYFDFIFSGDMDGLKNISTGKLLSQVETLHANSGYSEFLRKHYKNAAYELLEYRVDSSKKWMVSVNVTRKDGAENRFLIYIDRNSGSTESGQQMKIEDAVKQ
jgi:hypothetical protein